MSYTVCISSGHLPLSSSISTLLYTHFDKHIILNPYTYLLKTIESVHKKKGAFKRLEYNHRGNTYVIIANGNVIVNENENVA